MPFGYGGIFRRNPSGLLWEDFRSRLQEDGQTFLLRSCGKCRTLPGGASRSRGPLRIERVVDGPFQWAYEIDTREGPMRCSRSDVGSVSGSNLPLASTLVVTVPLARHCRSTKARSSARTRATTTSTSTSSEKKMSNMLASMRAVLECVGDSLERLRAACRASDQPDCERAEGDRS